MSRTLLALLLSATVVGCLHAPPPEERPGRSAVTSRWKGRGRTPDGRLAAQPAAQAPMARASRTGANPSAAEVVRILERSGLAFDTVEAGRQWRMVFAGKRLPRVSVSVLYGRHYTIVMGKLFTVAPSAGVEFYRALARKNFDLDQLKLSVDADGAVFASFEVPTRILDGRELLENVFGLAGAIDEVGPELARFAAPEDAPRLRPVPPGRRDPRIPPPTKDNPLIRAMRERVRVLVETTPGGARG